MTTLSRRGLMTALPALGLAGRAWGQDQPRIAPSALREDAAVLRRAYTELHPGLYRYNTPAEMAARFDRLDAWASEPRTLEEAHLALTGLTAAVRCGHSFLNGANQEGRGLALISGGRTRLPFRFAWLGERMVVVDGLGAHPLLRRGAEITSIGGVTPSRILASLVPLAAADGHNDAKRVRQLEVRGDDNWEPFDILFPLRWPALVRGGEARLRVSPAGGGPERAITVGLLDRQARLAQRAGVGDAAGSDVIWRTERLEGGVAWLRMPTWALYDSKWKWREALDADLDALAADKARALVVDLRGNAGGQDVGDLILARRVTRDVRKIDYSRFTRYRKTPADLDRYLKTWDRTFRDWGADAHGPDARGFYRMTRFDDDAEGDLLRPHPRPFKGKLIVLTDAANSSATFQFAYAARRNGLATLVGQTTGGNQRGINGSAFFFLRLPNTELEADLPLVAALPPTPRPDAGIAPDVKVELTLGDVAAERDPAREAALRLARA